MKYRYPLTVFALLLALLMVAAQAFGAELYPNDPTRDSGPAIVAHALACERIPAGRYWYKPPLDFGAGVGGKLYGVGGGDQARADGAWRNQPVTVLNPMPGYEGPKIRIRRSKFRVADVQLTGCTVRDYLADRGKGPVIEITQAGATWPVGDIELDCTLTNAELGLYCAPGNHADHCHMKLLTHAVDVPLTLNENQSVDHEIELLCYGDGKTIIDARNGGRVREADVRINGRWDCLLSMGDETQKTCPTKNNGYFNIRILVDGGDKIGTLVRERFAYEWSRPVVRIEGFAADDALIGDPQLLNKGDVRINIARCLRPAIVWPLAVPPAAN